MAAIPRPDAIVDKGVSLHSPVLWVGSLLNCHECASVPKPADCQFQLTLIARRQPSHASRSEPTLTAAATVLTTRKFGPKCMRQAMAIVMKNVACRVAAIGPTSVLTFGRAVLSAAKEPVAATAWDRDRPRTAEAAGGLSRVALAKR